LYNYFVIIKFKKLHKNAIIPKFSRDGDAAFDLSSTKSLIIKKAEKQIISTGLSSEFPSGYFVSFRDRSGLAANHGIHVLGGVIDANYRGEWKVILVNFGEKDYEIKKGDRVAQAIIHKLPTVKIVETKNLSTSNRGKKGFGSSGK